MKLTQEQKRVKIAEACGITDVQFTGVFVRELTGRIPNDSQRLPVPDYFNDLNACHEMELTLHERAWGTKDHFCNLLYNLVRPNRVGGLNHGLLYISATAAQRAEAFGLTLNLWTPDQ